MTSAQYQNYLLQPLGYGSLRNFFRVIIANRGVDTQYFIKFLYAFFLCLSGIPVRIFERVIFDHKIASTTIDYPPVFILGHWRSGTTYLHNLMIQDSNFAFVPSIYSYSPEMFLSLNSKKFMAPLLEALLPNQRPMDNVAYSIHVPEEEEYAIGNMMPLSFYNGWMFPKYLRQNFERSVLFQGLSRSLKAEWEKVYIKILKKTTFFSQGKRLLIKNPANTARIDTLLKLFPQSKFIYIYRNPYDVYSSTKLFYEKLMPTYALQQISEEYIEDCIFDFYEQLINQYLESKQNIPLGNIIEIKYEDFLGNEMMYLNKIYTQFNLPDFEEKSQVFLQYVHSKSKYIKNQHSLDRDLVKKIDQRWGFFIEQWGYDIALLNQL
ncbi:sulfotransferase family protein [Gloeothece verrucosa]|uniref:Sulfotransferase n=1 Tax=Gloeothece verrucosa (strain PCC 7822) TaxID=497965 RepID=E0UL77_GLOV7|nr:sulfotransferase [Gloeothece verrucosa]ADN17707.1 conserved hypothetical protein [Gloeothece verrucosa PCC 7822]